MACSCMEGYTWQSCTHQHWLPVVTVEVAAVQRRTIACAEHPDIAIATVLAQCFDCQSGKPNRPATPGSLGSINLALEHSTLDRKPRAFQVQVTPLQPYQFRLPQSSGHS